MKRFFRDKRHMFYTVCLIVFCLILLLNCLTPLAADDFSYAYSWSDPSERINSFSSLVKSQWRHWLLTNGRTVGHTIAQFFLWVGKPIFNIFNSIIFIIYIILISYLSFEKRSTVGILSSFFIVWFMIPEPGSVLFWLDGACNYLWTGTLIFLFVCRYYRSILKNEETPRKNFFLVLLWFLFGIITGWCNENTSGMGILICCLLTLYGYGKSKRVPLWKIAGILGAVLGFALMIMAPGNSVRLSNFDLPTNPLKRLFEGVIRANVRGFGLGGNDRILFFIFLSTYLFVLILPKINKERKIIGGIWFLGALACNYAMALSPTYPGRAAFGVYSMYFVSLFYSSKALIEHFNVKILVDISKMLLCMAFLYFSVSYPIAAGDIGLTYIQNSRRVETVLKKKSQGEYDITVPKMNPKTKYNVFSAISDWPNYSVVKYYGVNSIEVKK